MFGWQEWLIIIVIVLIIFGGAKKLPGLARSLGKSFREFKKAVKDVKEEVSVDLDEELDDVEKKDSVISDTEKSEKNV